MPSKVELLCFLMEFPACLWSVITLNFSAAAVEEIEGLWSSWWWKVDPIWNQKLSFNFDKTQNHQYQNIDISVYHEKRLIEGRSFLGRVRISCSNIAKEGEETYQRFHLENKWFLSAVKGEIGLKIYISPPKKSPINPQEPPISNPPTRVVSDPPITSALAAVTKADGVPVSDIQEEPKKDVLKISQSKDNSTLPVAECPTKDPAKETKEEIEEPIEPRQETTQLHKQQTMQRPRIVVQRRPQGASSSMNRNIPPTMNTRNSEANLSNQDDYEIRDTNPQLGEQWPNGGGYGGRSWLSGERHTSTYDLVEQMFYLYVRVMKARDLPSSSITGGCDPYVEVKLGNYKGRTKHFDKKQNPEWNQVFAFSKERIQSSALEVFVKDKEMLGRDDYLGRVVFDLNEVPTRVPPDSPLAPQWYRLEDRRGTGKVRGEIMVAVWMGTQADEAFPEAWHSDAASVFGEGVHNVRSKVYVSPKLWYLRLNVIEAQDVIPNDRNRLPDLFVKVQVGNQVLRTKISSTSTTNPFWNEDLVFVVAEPFEEQLVITIEDRVHPSKEDVLGQISLPLDTFDKRLDYRPVHSRWFNLEKYGFGVLEADRRKELKFSSRIHLRASLEGGYHVLDESTLYISDQRPTAKQLWKPPVGILEVGILSAQELLPMKMKDGRGSTDAYCIAKYGQKWVRTRTILNTFSPKWNEQYTWEVYDPCTVITLGVFDNCHLGGGEKHNGSSGARDSRIGKVRIRLSTLEAHKTYTHSYPLLVLHPTGVKKMGELQLAIRFTTLSLANMIYIYGNPLLPKMHYLQPFTVNQIENLRYQAMNIVATRLSRAEPPLRKEVIEYMLDVDSHVWSMRRSKANFFRIMSLLSGMISVTRWFREVCNWRNPITSVLVHILFLILIWYPELILPTVFLYMFLIGLWNYRFRPRHPPHMDTKLSWAEAVNPDELDEEFDTFPTSKPNDLVRLRYDRLRSVAGRIQTVVGDIATQGERVQSLLSWRDPRATSLFIVFCLCTAAVLYATPFRVVALVAGLYCLRHPKFRSKLPSVPGNFFKRLPPQTDSLL
ncbi:protein QUIRKY [Cucumis melo var. makuwa]|uniref:Protein QUIRKY n=1 Tax=Cucumis melo var. makuwa TaxID=1194695 RepID=A0A5D3CH18_CUCMM|nr:protein QUIRKY [Cucumis melo var. makuwa]TYK10660.1 protein QUIRKY [Cucumis melo var. makuwa]